MGGSLWRHGDFMKLWAAESISQLGTQVTFLALPLTAILILDASAFQLGVLSALETLPFLLVGLPAGVWVDRMRRRPILITGDLGRAIVLFSIPLTYWLGGTSMGLLYAAAFATGLFTVFFDVAYQSYLPSLVDRDRLTEGNAKLEISRSAAQLAGPGLAGMLVQLLTAPAAILADAVSYLGSAAFVGGIRRSEPPVEPPGEEEHPRMRTEIAEGLRYVLKHPLLRPIAACTSISNLFGSMMFAILVLFAVRHLELAPGAIGLALAIGNVGTLLGAFLAGRAARAFGLGWTIIGSAAMFGVGAALIALATPSTGFAMIVASGIVAGMSNPLYNVNQVSLRQAITPDRMQGRMHATMRFVVWGTLPVGGLIGGALGSAIGLRPTIWISAIGSFIAVLPPLLSPVRRLREIPAADARGQGSIQPGS